MDPKNEENPFPKFSLLLDYPRSHQELQETVGINTEDVWS